MFPRSRARPLVYLFVLMLPLVAAGCARPPAGGALDEGTAAPADAPIPRVVSVSPAAGSVVNLGPGGVLEVKVGFTSGIDPGKVSVSYSGGAVSTHYDSQTHTILIRIETKRSRGEGPYNFTAVFRDHWGRQVPLDWSGTVKAGAGATDPKTTAYDTLTLRAGASFEVAVAQGVYWVPANSLGAPKFTSQEILDLGRDPAVLRARVNTLHDVIHYVQAVNFREASDNIRRQHDPLSWEFHKPGPEAIRTNEGCCATISNLLAYLLAGDYDEVGFIQCSWEDGEGHVFNYIRHGGSYYTVDLTHYRLDFLSTAVETGDFEDLQRFDRVLGNVLRAERLQDFIAYFLKEANDPPKLFVAYAGDSVLDIGTRWLENGRVELYYPTGSDVRVLWDDPDDRLSLSFAAAPPGTVNWDHVPTAFIGPRPGTVPAALEIRFAQNPWRVFEGGGQQHWVQRIEVAETSGVDVQLVEIRISRMLNDGFFHQDSEQHHAPVLFREGSILEHEKKGYLRGGTSLFWGAGGSGSCGVLFEEITVRGIDANGHWVSATARVHFEHGPPPVSADSYNRSIAESSPYDTANLRANADFRVGVAPGVYWVPAVRLGNPKYTREEILALGSSPEALRSSIGTLYDVIQYVQAVNFTFANDNRRTTEAGIDWEHHKPGVYAIRTNEGCCATISNLLAYLLAGDYEEIGFLSYSHENGSGHVLNYIVHNGKYYLVDMTCHRNDFLGGRVETGEAHHYFPKNNMIAGYIHEVEHLEDYVAYCMAEFNSPPDLWAHYAAPGVLPIGTVFGPDRVTLYYPEGSKSKVRVLWDNPTDPLFLKFVQGPTKAPDWSR